MFTGIVEAIGVIEKVTELDATETGGSGWSMIIGGAEGILQDVALGDSISVNGTCLTVTEFTTTSFKVGVAPETLRRTNLGSLKVKSNVNLERALSTTSKAALHLAAAASGQPTTGAAEGEEVVEGDVDEEEEEEGVEIIPTNTRFGGHFVQGHVDTIATVVDVKPDGNALAFTFQPREKDVLRYIVEKGYVCIDGASLTVTAVDDEKGTFGVMLIAYTQGKVVTAAKKAGDVVNVEVDMVGKYVEKSVAAYMGRPGESKVGEYIKAFVEEIVDRKLAGK